MYVVTDIIDALLSCKTEIQAHLDRLTQTLQTYEETFQGTGKLKRKQVKFQIDGIVQPVSLHIRLIPFRIRK